MNYYADRLSRIRRIGPKIDLGCGKKCRPGFVGIDFQEFGQDVRWDIRYGIPFPDNSVDEIFTSHFVEHLTETEIMMLWVEMLRICKPGARIEIRCPHAGTIEAFYHNHLSLWTVQRIKGVVAGLHGSAAPGEKYPSVVEAGVLGIELVAILTIKTK